MRVRTIANLLDVPVGTFACVTQCVYFGSIGMQMDVVEKNPDIFQIINDGELTVDELIDDKMYRNISRISSSFMGSQWVKDNCKFDLFIEVLLENKEEEQASLHKSFIGQYVPAKPKMMICPDPCSRNCDQKKPHEYEHDCNKVCPPCVPVEDTSARDLYEILGSAKECNKHDYYVGILIDIVNYLIEKEANNE
jgi:hypothetical protein